MMFLEILKLFENYLQNRQQRVVLNGTAFNCQSVTAGVPQRSVLVPYINDLTHNISSQMHLFADNSSLFVHVEWVGQTHEKLVKEMQIGLINEKLSLILI